MAWLLATLLLMLSPDAHAQAVALDSLVRVHGGVSFVRPVAVPGVMVGMDTRLTRLMAVDVVGFYSPLEPDAWSISPDAEIENLFRLRHGVLMAPGIRIPHGQPQFLSWDLIFRGGVGAIWLADLSGMESVQDDYRSLAVPTGLLGADLGLHPQTFGIRLAFRQFFLSPFSWEERETVNVAVSPSSSSEDERVRFR